MQPIQLHTPEQDIDMLDKLKHILIRGLSYLLYQVELLWGKRSKGENAQV